MAGVNRVSVVGAPTLDVEGELGGLGSDSVVPESIVVERSVVCSVRELVGEIVGEPNDADFRTL